MSALQSADVVLMTAGAAQVASVLPDLTRPPSGRALRVQAQVRQDLLDHRPLEFGRHLQHRSAQLGLCSQRQAQRAWQPKLTNSHPMPHRHMRYVVIDKVRRGLR
jgi:hypothetical protein